jgi:hypothetical protein
MRLKQVTQQSPFSRIDHLWVRGYAPLKDGFYSACDSLLVTCDGTDQPNSRRTVQMQPALLLNIRVANATWMALRTRFSDCQYPDQQGLPSEGLTLSGSCINGVSTLENGFLNA